MEKKKAPERVAVRARNRPTPYSSNQSTNDRYCEPSNVGHHISVPELSQKPRKLRPRREATSMSQDATCRPTTEYLSALLRVATTRVQVRAVQWKDPRNYSL